MPDPRQMELFSEWNAERDHERSSRAHTAYPLRCLKTKAPSQWNHKNMWRDVRTVAVWCGCPDCEKSLSRS